MRGIRPLSPPTAELSLRASLTALSVTPWACHLPRKWEAKVASLPRWGMEFVRGGECVRKWSLCAEGDCVRILVCVAPLSPPCGGALPKGEPFGGSLRSRRVFWGAKKTRPLGRMVLSIVFLLPRRIRDISSALREGQLLQWRRLRELRNSIFQPSYSILR